MEEEICASSQGKGPKKKILRKMVYFVKKISQLFMMYK